MHLTLADGRPAHLTRVHAALTGLPKAGQVRLGVTAGWKTGPHQLIPAGPSTPSAWSRTRWPKTTPAAPRRKSCRPS